MKYYLIFQKVYAPEDTEHTQPVAIDGHPLVGTLEVVQRIPLESQNAYFVVELQEASEVGGGVVGRLH